MDIEGGESDLINNELDVLEKNCEIAIIEFHEGYSSGVKKAKKNINNSTFELIECVEGINVYFNKKYHSEI